MAPTHDLGLLPEKPRKAYAAEALTQYGLVRLNSDGELEMCDTQGEEADGWVDRAYAADDLVTYYKAGRLATVIGDKTSVVLGARLTPSAEGSPATPGRSELAASGDYAIGQALETPSADGDVIAFEADFSAGRWAKA